MKVKRSECNGVPVLHLAGEFDSFETELVRKGFDECLRSGHKSVVLDLSEMTFANSTTLAYFITAQTQAREDGGAVILVSPNAFIKKTMETLGLQHVLSISDSIEDASQALKA